MQERLGQGRELAEHLSIRRRLLQHTHERHCQRECRRAGGGNLRWRNQRHPVCQSWAVDDHPSGSQRFVCSRRNIFNNRPWRSTLERNLLFADRGDGVGPTPAPSLSNARPQSHQSRRPTQRPPAAQVTPQRLALHALAAQQTPTVRITGVWGQKNRGRRSVEILPRKSGKVCLIEPFGTRPMEVEAQK